MNMFYKLLILISTITLAPCNVQSTSRIFNRQNLAIAAGTLAIGGASYKAANSWYFNKIHWDWKNIDPTTINIRWGQFGYEYNDRKEPWKQISVAEFFKIYQDHLAHRIETGTPSQNEWLWGAATAAHQVEGYNTNNQWYTFENQIMNGKLVEPAGIGCDSWNHEDEDIQNMLDLGLNTYRFSVEWSKIFPACGLVDDAVLNHYKQFCKKLVNAGIKPVITLYHYTEPIWFYKMGGFEKEENIKHFVDFCTTVFNALHEDVYAWFTFNAPEGIALGGWLAGVKPPYKKDMKLAVEVLHNVLEAHVRVYQACKALPGGSQSRIGILKNILQLDPWNIANPLDHLGCYMGGLLQDESIYKFFTTGEFKVYIPFKVNARYYNPAAPTALDFIGLNYYCHNYMKNFKTIREPNEAIEIHQRNDRYTIYGEGLYRAIEEISKRLAKPLHIPIYITENGIGTDSDEDRTLHNQRYIYAMARAIQDGHDVRGYIHWSLMDNYEWGEYNRFYGLYHVNRSTPELKRTKKKSAAYFESVVKGSKA